MIIMSVDQNLRTITVKLFSCVEFDASKLCNYVSGSESENNYC